ncbi:MAG: hypothetical protein IJH20_03165 [Bacilli bacterium]|nr:hypothetical protein [Bacilli bacterium]
MILYVTKKTKERLNIPMIDELSDISKNNASIVLNNEEDTELLKWGIKIFYMDRRKCLQAVNFASKLTIYLFDIHNDSIEYIGDAMANYMYHIYDNDEKMTNLLNRLFNEHSLCVFSNLTDKTAISTLNYNERCYVNTYRFYDYIENNTLKTIEINKDVNFDNLLTVKINGKREYIVPGEYFKELLTNYYKRS